MNYTHQTELIIWEGEEEIELSLTLHYDWQEEEPMSNDHPGCAAEATLNNVTCDNSVFDFLKISEATSKDMEWKCYQSMFNDSSDDSD